MDDFLDSAFAFIKAAVVLVVMVVVLFVGLGMVFR